MMRALQRLAAAEEKLMLRSLIPHLLILIVSALTTVGQLLLKIGMKGQPIEFSVHSLLQLVWRVLTTPALLGGWLCGTIATLVWLIVLSRLHLGYAAPLMAASYFVFLTVASRYVLEEPLTLARLGGIAFLVVGIVLLGSDTGSVGALGPGPGAVISN
jgi:multidrug transporter EmrE-like cation transporter